MVIAENCRIRNATTLGIKLDKDGNYKCPVIGNNVDIGAGYVIIGNPARILDKV